jgi:hypothetical protein
VPVFGPTHRQGGYGGEGDEVGTGRGEGITAAAIRKRQRPIAEGSRLCRRLAAAPGQEASLGGGSVVRRCSAGWRGGIQLAF